MSALHSPINHRAVLRDLAGQLLRRSRCGRGSSYGWSRISAATSRHNLLCYVFTSLVWIPNSYSFFLSLGWRRLLLRRHYDRCGLIHWLTWVKRRSISIGEVPRSWSRIKRTWPRWLNWILLWGPNIRRATMTVLWNTVLRPLGHWVRHGQMVNHHDVLISLVHCSGCLCTRTNGWTAVRDGSSRRLYLRPLEKRRTGLRL